MRARFSKSQGRLIRVSALSCLLPLVLCLAGCALFMKPLAYYDATTYKNLTDLKPEIAFLYDSFAGDSVVDASGAAAVRLKLAQMYEYEKGKRGNAETARQIQIIQGMFDRHFRDRITSGKWNEAHMSNLKENISDAFDSAIRTEGTKNRNE